VIVCKCGLCAINHDFFHIFQVKHNEETVMNITMAKEESHSLYTVNFVSKKEDELMRIHPNLKAMLVLFSILYVQE